MSFLSQISNYVDKTEKKLSEVSKDIKISLFTGILDDTRYDTGYMKGNWQVSSDRPLLGEIDRYDPSGDQVRNEIINNVTDGDDYFTNNVSYVGIYEDRDGMVAKNLLRIERTIKESVENN